jgi:hypothetical protein
MILARPPLELKEQAAEELGNLMPLLESREQINRILLELDINPAELPAGPSHRETVAHLLDVANVQGKLPRLLAILRAHDQVSDQEFWAAAKEAALAEIRAERLDTPESHTAYIRKRINPIFDHVQS